jgi:mannosyltransferase OCH1-like enzyme
MILIPRVFHRIWLGPNAMPDEYVEFGRSWENKHPGWEMRLWTEANRPRLQNEECFRRALTYSQKADILRYELIYELGGVYIDTDFQCLKCIEPLLADLTFFGAGENEGIASIGIFGAVPHHIVCFRLMRAIPRQMRMQGVWPSKATGPGLMTSVIAGFRGTRDVKVYGPGLFYPYHWTEKHRRHEEFPDAYAVHHWAGSWTAAYEDSHVQGP